MVQVLQVSASLWCYFGKY